MVLSILHQGAQALLETTGIPPPSAAIPAVAVLVLHPVAVHSPAAAVAVPSARHHAVPALAVLHAAVALVHPAVAAPLAAAAVVAAAEAAVSAADKNKKVKGSGYPLPFLFYPIALTFQYP